MPDLLHHYCSNHALLGILDTDQLVLSELSLSNDRLEGQWIREVFSTVCSAKGISEYDKSRLMDHLDRLIAFIGATGFCLSEDGDMLSQWRGYADDGAGVSIGFSKEALAALPDNDNGFAVSLNEVLYDPAEQEKALAPLSDGILEEVKAGAFEHPDGSLLSPTTSERKKAIQEAFSRLTYRFLAMFPHLYTLKNPAFGEEKEWRLISYITRLTDDIEKSDLPRLDFIARRDRIIPIRKLSLKNAQQQIFRVTLGPRNITPENVMKAALSKYGFKDVEVIRSKASYRRLEI